MQSCMITKKVIMITIVIIFSPRSHILLVLCLPDALALFNGQYSYTMVMQTVHTPKQ